MSIHRTAIVDRKAKIGKGVSVGAYTVVGPEVELGDGCTLHHHVTVEGHTTMGERCEVFPQAVIGLPPQDLKFHGEQTRLEIGSGNIFREMVTVHRGTGNGGGLTRIGDNNLVLIGVHIAHDCKIGNNCVVANYVQFAGHVQVEDNVNMGGHSAVHHFATIGKHAFIGGMTRVTADVPPFMVVVAARGTRSEVRMINGVGLQRSGYSNEDINALKAAFMQIYSRRARMSGIAIRDRVQTILDRQPLNPHVKYLCDHLMRSFAHGRHGRYLESLRPDQVHRSSWKLQNEHTLTVSVVGRGAVDRSIGDNDGIAHDVCELNAVADSGWRFAGWNGGLTGQDNPIRVVVDSDKTVTATFTEIAT